MRDDDVFSTTAIDSIATQGQKVNAQNGSVYYHLLDIADPEPETVTLTSAQRYMLEQEEFYKSYDPSVGYNTAAILAGLLIAILMYVFYRTKIRKPLIRFVKRKFKELINKTNSIEEEDEEKEINDVETQKYDEKKSEKSSKHGCESVKDSAVNFSIGKEKLPMSDNLQCQFSIDEQTNLPKLTITDEDNQALPIVFMDMDEVTANWVQKQHQFLHPGGLIVKVKSDNICPQNNEIHPSHPNGPHSRQVTCTNPHCRLNVKDDVICGAHSQNALNLCKSIPMFDSHGLTPLQIENTEKRHRRKYPCRPRRFSSVASDSKYTHPAHAQPIPHNALRATKLREARSDHKTPLIKQSSVPLHITPIIKIQNFDKSRSNSNDMNKNDSRESLSSSSSENPTLYNTPADRWHSHNHYPPLSRSMTEETPPPSRTCHRHNHASRLQQNYKQMSLEEACQMGLLIPVNKLSQSSLSCQNMSHTEETTL